MNLYRKSFDDRGFADAGLTDKDDIVLSPPAQDLDGPLQFSFPADQRIDLVFGSLLGQVYGKGPERVFDRHLPFTRMACGPGLLPGKDAPSASFDTPCERYSRTSRRCMSSFSRI